MERSVLYQVQENVAGITVNRPLVLNAINKELKLQLHEALERLDHDSDFLVGLLTGSCKASLFHATTASLITGLVN